jgi:hypothetical protein
MKLNKLISLGLGFILVLFFSNAHQVSAEDYGMTDYYGSTVADYGVTDFYTSATNYYGTTEYYPANDVTSYDPGIISDPTWDPYNMSVGWDTLPGAWDYSYTNGSGYGQITSNGYYEPWQYGGNSYSYPSYGGNAYGTSYATYGSTRTYPSRNFTSNNYSAQNVRYYPPAYSGGNQAYYAAASAAAPSSVQRTRPSCTIRANYGGIVSGEAVKLTWSSSHASSASISGLGDVAENGSRTVYPKNTTTYSMRVSGDGMGGTCEVTVDVKEVAKVVAKKPTCAILSNKTSIVKGESVGLSWASENGSTATLERGSTVSNEALVGTKVVAPQSSKTYTLRVNGVGGSTTCSTHISVAGSTANSGLVSFVAY